MFGSGTQRSGSRGSESQTTEVDRDGMACEIKSQRRGNDWLGEGGQVAAWMEVAM